ncbi:MAG: histidine phosphotransferase [Rhodobacteraceae bacterium]|nr:histidine phosphotransferase [Paracoccaceae bacterium]
MSANSPDITALIGSRICHDLISPIGAIGNGVELLTMTETGPTPEISLITESVENANARIRLFRIAFGEASEASVVSTQEVRSILDDLRRGGRVSFSLDTQIDQLDRRRTKVLFLLLLCLESAMPFGGRTTIRTNEKHWSIDARSEKLRIDQAEWQALVSRDPGTEIRAGNVHFALVSDAAARAETVVETHLTEEEVRISF